MTHPFTPTRRGNPCQICADTSSKCRETDSELLLCMTFADAIDRIPGFKFVGQTKDGLWGEWLPSSELSTADRDDWQQKQRQRREIRSQQEQQRRSAAMPAVERDRLYRDLLDQLSLHPSDRADLRRRGLSDEEIAAGGFKSVEQWQRLSFELPSTLPGVSLDGLSLNTQAGYLCPIRDVDGLIVGFQLRLRDADEGGRYRWFSSRTKKRPNGATAHLPNGENPITVARPILLLNPGGNAGVRRRAIGIAEGILKPFIASQRLGQIVFGAAGGLLASSLQTLKHSLEQLSAELGTRSIEFYPDAGAIENRNVMRRDRAAWKLLQDWGYEVSIAWWGQVDKAAGDIDELESFDAIQFISVEQFEAIALAATERENHVIEQHNREWEEKRVTTARNTWLRSRAYTPTETEKQQFVGVDQARLLQSNLHFLRSGMGTGKTQEIARLLSQVDSGVIAIGSRNTLLLQSCERWGNFYHLHQDNAFSLIADPKARIACCLDSLLHFKDSDFNGKIIILDELTSIIKHALFSSTLRDKRDRCLQKLEQAIKRAAVVVGWDGNNCDIAVNYVIALRGDDARVIKQLNTYQGDRLTVEMVRSISSETGKLSIRDHSPVARKLIESLEAFRLLPAGEAKAIVVVSDSQRLCQALDEKLTDQGYRVRRIDSTTVSKEEVRQFLANPNQHIAEHPLDVLILSPSAESGIDISIKGYFRKGFGFFFGVVDTATQMQFLRRVRDCYDWMIWCCEYSASDDGEGLRSSFGRSLSKQLLEYLELDAVAALRGTDREALAQQWFKDLRQQSDDPHFQAYIQFAAARNYERSHTRECLQTALEADGHAVVLTELEKHKPTNDALKAAKQAIVDSDSCSIFNAPDISTSEAAQIKASFSASIEQRFSAEKAMLKARLPGIEETPVWDVELVKRLLFSDRALLSQLERFWMLKNMGAARVRAREYWTEVLETGQFLPDIRSDFAMLTALDKLGILPLVESGKKLSAESEEVQSVLQRCKRSKKLQTALKRKPGKLKPMDWVGRLIRLIGCKSSSRFIRETGTREYAYSTPEADPVCAEILKCFDRKFEKYVNLEMAESHTEQVSEVDHLAPTEIHSIGQGDLTQTLTGIEIAPAYDRWFTPDSLADIRSMLEAAAGDRLAMIELRRIIPQQVLERAILRRNPCGIG